MYMPLIIGWKRTNEEESVQLITEEKGIREYLLESNNLRVLVYPERSAPVATVMVTYTVGSADEQPGETGATHFLEHMMFKGTENFNRKNKRSIFDVLQGVGARINATTWLDRTNYYEQLPVEHIDLALEIEADRMRGLLLDPAEIESEKTVILNEHDRGENAPFRRLNKEVWKTVFSDHPYGHPTIGYREDIEAVSRDSLRRYYDSFYWPSNATISVIGDVDFEGVTARIERLFGDMDSTRRHIRQRAVLAKQEQERRCEVEMVGDVGTLMFALPTVSALHDDSTPLSVLADIISTGKRSPLYSKLIDTQLASSAGGSSIVLRDSGVFWVYVNLASGASFSSVEAASKAAIFGATFGEKELARSKASMLASEPLDRDGTFQIASLLNSAIAVGDWRQYSTYLDRVKAVSLSDVKRVAEKYLIPERLTVGKFNPTKS